MFQTRKQSSEKSRELLLREKRERERERRKRIREDPVKKEKQREKERQKYLRQKENKIKKSVQDMTPREQRQIRKKWKENSKNYRLRIKKMKVESALLEVNTPPASSDEEDLEEHRKTTPKQREIGRTIANTNKMRRYRQRKETEKKLQCLKKKVELYKKRYYRLLEKVKPKQKCNSLEPDLTPITKVNALLNGSQIDSSKVEEVKKNLIFGEIIQQQLMKSYKELKSDRHKQLVKKMLNGDIVKKYKMKTKVATAIKYRKTFKTNNSCITKFERKKSQRSQRSDNIKRKIEEFLELEINSRVCPGKKEFVKKNKIIKQKRFLSNTLKNLYMAFIQSFPNLKVSYKFFCLSRPFWIQAMKMSDRDTCKCVTHSNMELIVQSLYSNNIIFAKKPSDIISDICCNTRDEECLLRKCKTCSESKPHFKEYDENIPLQYFQWINLKQNYFDKKTKTLKQNRKVVKQPQQVITSTLITVFLKKLPSFMSHEARILHQHTWMSDLKKALKSTEILIHCDFSENYSLKYTEETQAFHFGGSRQQITLHTVVVYHREGSETRHKSFCTLSESLNHGPSAIWAHLWPILKEFYEKNVKIIHFLSDSPATQYRNKYMFSFITNHFIKQFPKVERVTWNYHEAGHGKGAPDGIGGVCKRSADRVILQGKDLPDFSTLVRTLKECCPGISFHAISPEEIDVFSNIINEGPILAYKGTMKVHQVVTGQGKLWLRSLSCFACIDYCKHYHLGCISYQQSQSDSDYDYDLYLSTLKNTITKSDSSKKLKYKDVYSDDEEPSCSFSHAIKTGKYLLVSLKSVNKKQSLNYRYVAVCQSEFEDDEIKVAFLKLSDPVKGDTFKLGEDDDISYIKEEQIIEVLPEPNLIIKGHRIYYKFPKPVNVFECA